LKHFKNLALQPFPAASFSTERHNFSKSADCFDVDGKLSHELTFENLYRTGPRDGRDVWCEYDRFLFDYCIKVVAERGVGSDGHTCWFVTVCRSVLQ